MTAPKFLTSERTQALDAQHQPEQIAMGKYFIPGGLGHAESEEIAARVLMCCREEGKFVAPSYRTITRKIAQEFEEQVAVMEARSAHFEAIDRINQQQSIRGRIAKNLPTLAKILGIPAFEAVQIPELPDEQQTVSRHVFSPIIVSLTFGGRNILPYELKLMIDKGYLIETVVGEDVYYEPTAALISKLLQEQEKRIARS